MTSRTQKIVTACLMSACEIQVSWGKKLISSSLYYNPLALNLYMHIVSLSKKMLTYTIRNKDKCNRTTVENFKGKSLKLRKCSHLVFDLYIKFKLSLFTFSDETLGLTHKTLIFFDRDNSLAEI